MRCILRWVVMLLVGYLPLSAVAQASLSVELSGLSGEELENVMQLLSIEQRKSHPQLNEAWIRRLHAKAGEEVKQALAPFGYYRVKVESSLTETEGGWTAAYRIDPGPSLPIGALDIAVSGAVADDPAFRDLLPPPALAVGSPFNHTQYEQWKNDVLRLADELGYFEAVFTRHRVAVDLKGYQARIDLQFDSGPRYRFGHVTITGDSLLEETLVRRYIPFSAGEPYSAGKLLQLQEGLHGSHYFSRVDIKAERDAVTDLEVPITVNLKMNMRTRYELGLGYGTDTGIRGSIGMERRYVNPMGHHIKAGLELSQIKDSLSADYIIPMENPRTDRVVIHSQYSRDRTEDIDSAALLLGAGVERMKGRWYNSYFLNFQREKFKIGDQSGNARLLMPVLYWRRLDSSNVLNTVQGSRIGLELRGAREGIGSNTSVARLLLNGKYIHSLGNGRLLFRGEAGTSWAPEFDNLPPSVRFFAGGDNSVRGYRFKSLGPEDGSGDVIGGKHLLVASAEYELRLGEKWRGAVFFDAGNAFAEYRGEVEQGAGIGLRRRLPIGWLRVDVAQALTHEDQPWRLHITLGPDL